MARQKTLKPPSDDTIGLAVDLVGSRTNPTKHPDSLTVSSLLSALRFLGMVSHSHGQCNPPAEPGSWSKRAASSWQLNRGGCITLVPAGPQVRPPAERRRASSVADSPPLSRPRFGFHAAPMNHAHFPPARPGTCPTAHRFMPRFSRFLLQNVEVLGTRSKT
jgi:hypothetical protein